MNKSTQEWEALLDAAKVPNGLEVRYDDWNENWQIGAEDQFGKFPGWWYIAECDSEHKARLLASVLDAVSEVIRLRKALEGLRENLDGEPSPNGDYMYEQGWDYALDIVDQALARILGGESSNG